MMNLTSRYVLVYHCTPYIHEYLQDIPYAGTVRVGIGPFNTKEDIDTLIEAVESL